MPVASSILVVDDEPNLLATLSAIFQRAGHTVMVASCLDEARQRLHGCPVDMVFLDLKMNGGDSLAFLAEVHRENPSLPVLYLTAHASLESAVEALRLGARDYMLKPVDPAQILLRVEEVLEESRPRRLPETSPASLEAGEPAAPADCLVCGQLALEPKNRQVFLGGREVHLSPTAFQYLWVLARHAPRPVAPADLVSEAQGFLPSRHEALDLARWRMHELRQALEPDPRQPVHIVTVRGAGYRLVV